MIPLFQSARINYRKTTSVSAPGPVKIGQEKTQGNSTIVTMTGLQSVHVFLNLVDLSKIVVDFRATTVVNKFQDWLLSPSLCKINLVYQRNAI